MTEMSSRVTDMYALFFPFILAYTMYILKLL